MALVLYLDLFRLAELQPNLETCTAQHYINAATVSLYVNDFKGDVLFSLKEDDGDFSGVQVRCPECTERMLRTHNDLQYAAEHGACGLALVYFADKRGLRFTIQSTKGDGFDYWLESDSDDEFNFLKTSARLEVSGITKCSPRNSLKQRMQKKARQPRPSSDPTFATVVSFCGLSKVGEMWVKQVNYGHP